METKDIKVKRHMNLIPIDYHVVRRSSSGAIRHMWSTIDRYVAGRVLETPP